MEVFQLQGSMNVGMKKTYVCEGAESFGKQPFVNLAAAKAL